MTTNSYPFVTKSSLKSRIAQDDAFVLECLQIMNGRQTELELEQGSTIFRNRCGWSSSHAAPGKALATKAALDIPLTAEELDKARSMVSSYTKQLARHFREQAIAENPALAATGRVFGV